MDFSTLRTVNICSAELESRGKSSASQSNIRRGLRELRGEHYYFLKRLNGSEMKSHVPCLPEGKLNGQYRKLFGSIVPTHKQGGKPNHGC